MVSETGIFEHQGLANDHDTLVGRRLALGIVNNSALGAEVDRWGKGLLSSGMASEH